MFAIEVIKNMDAAMKVEIKINLSAPRLLLYTTSPPKARPKPPFPLCKRINPIRTKDTIKCITKRIDLISSLV